MTQPAGTPPQVVVPGAGWVDVASRAIAQVGFPVVIAGVLLWYLLTRFQTNMDLISARMQSNTQGVAALIEQQRQEFEEIKRQSIDLTEQTRLMRSIATDAAKIVDMRTAEVEALKRMQGHAPRVQP